MRRLMRKSFSREALVSNVPQVVGLITELIRQQELGKHIPAARFMQHITTNILGVLSNERMPGEYFDAIVTWWTTLLEVHVSHLKPVSVLQTPKYQHARQRAKEFASLVFEERKQNRPAEDEDNLLGNLARRSGRQK